MGGVPKIEVDAEAQSSNGSRGGVRVRKERVRAVAKKCFIFYKAPI